MASSFFGLRSSALRSSLSQAASARPLGTGPVQRFILSAGSRSVFDSRPFSASSLARAAVSQKGKKPPKKKLPKHVSLVPLKQVDQFSLCDAMRYLQAFEVGFPDDSPKYELSIRMNTLRNGPVIRSSVNLPYFNPAGFRLGVICPPDSVHAEEARAGGAAVVGEDDVIADVMNGKVDFNYCIAHESSYHKLTPKDVARAFGVLRLMPTPKKGTVVSSIKDTMATMVGKAYYNERAAVIRISIGQLSLTPEQLRDNIQTFMKKLREDMSQLDAAVAKSIHEVVLSTTHGPGISLNGSFRSEKSLPTDQIIFARDSKWEGSAPEHQKVIKSADPRRR